MSQNVQTQPLVDPWVEAQVRALPDELKEWGRKQYAKILDRQPIGKVRLPPEREFTITDEDRVFGQGWLRCCTCATTVVLAKRVVWNDGKRVDQWQVRCPRGCYQSDWDTRKGQVMQSYKVYASLIQS